MEKNLLPDKRFQLVFEFPYRIFDSFIQSVHLRPALADACGVKAFEDVLQWLKLVVGALYDISRGLNKINIRRIQNMQNCILERNNCTPSCHFSYRGVGGGGVGKRNNVGRREIGLMRMEILNQVKKWKTLFSCLLLGWMKI